MTDTVFGFDKPEDSPGFLLWQTTTLWQRQVKKALAAYDISHAQFVILAVTFWFESTGQDITQSAIIEKTKLDKMTVSAALKQLAKKAYINRIEHKTDTRAKAVILTGNGKKLISNLVPVIEAVDRDFFNALSKTDCQYLTEKLNNIIDNSV